MQEKNDVPGTNRIEAFSDGVIAIIITIMVFDIKIPETSAQITSTEARIALINLLPKLFTYLLSFIVLATMWVNHHAMYHKIKHSTNQLIWYNTNLLFWMSLIPLPTAYIAKYPFLPEASLFYGIVLGICSISFMIMRNYAERNHLIPGSASFRLANIISPSLYFSAGIFAYLSVFIAFLIFILIPCIYFLPDKLEKKIKK